MTNTGILITPITNEDLKTISIHIEHIDMSKLNQSQNNLKRMYELIECDTVDVVRTSLGDIWLDDEGLNKSSIPVLKFTIANQSFTLAGKMLVSKGADEEGETLWFNEAVEADFLVMDMITSIFKDARLIGFTE